MNELVTLEDINTILFNNQQFYWHEIDTSKISSTEDFTDVKYDFCEVTRITTGNTGSTAYVYLFKVKASNWAGGYKIFSGFGGNVSRSGYSFGLYSSKANIVVYLYMGNLSIDAYPHMDYDIITPLILNLNLRELSIPQIIRYKYFVQYGATYTISRTLESGYNRIVDDNLFIGYIFVNLVKTDFQFTCNQSLTIGKINKVQLGTDRDYKPNGDYVGDYTPRIKVLYKNNEIPVYFDSNLNDYCFDLDLTDKTNPTGIFLTIKVEANECLNSTEELVRLNSDYDTISTFSQLKSVCGENGTKIVKLGANITLTEDIIVKQDVKIIGCGKTLNLNSNHKFVINEGIKVNISDISFVGGQNAIKQKKNSILDLYNCSFTNCVGFGACISCDVDYTSLEIADEFTTVLKDCIFTNNDTCIVHGGNITIIGCKYHNTDVTYSDSENVAFLYQIDGDATIKNSIFDIDYITDSLCTNSKSIGFAQALIHCGLNARINGAIIDDLKHDNALPFSDSTYKNRSHVFVKYFYNQANTCVFTSPLPSKEDEAVCYCVSNDNNVYKQNVIVTKASDGTENTTRKIEW